MLFRARNDDCLTYQAMSVPDDLIFAMYSPVERRHHTLKLLLHSGWESVMEQWMNIENIQYNIYGDCAYMLRKWMQRPFAAELAEDQLCFNALR